MSAHFFQRMFNEMTPLEQLPGSAHEGDLAKTMDGTAWVWFQCQWVRQDEAMNLVYNVQGGAPK